MRFTRQGLSSFDKEKENRDRPVLVLGLLSPQVSRTSRQSCCTCRWPSPLPRLV